MSFKAWMVYIGLWVGGIVSAVLALTLVVFSKGIILLIIPPAWGLWAIFTFDDEDETEITLWRNRNKKKGD